MVLLSNNSTLYRYIPEEDVLRPVYHNLGAFGVTSMTLDSEDRLWVISGGGFLLHCYSTKDFSLQGLEPAVQRPDRLPGLPYSRCP